MLFDWLASAVLLLDNRPGTEMRRPLCSSSRVGVLQIGDAASVTAKRSSIGFMQAAYTLIGSLQSAHARQMHTVHEMRKCGNLCLMAHSNMAGYQHTHSNTGER